MERSRKPKATFKKIQKREAMDGKKLNVKKTKYGMRCAI